MVRFVHEVLIATAATKSAPPEKNPSFTVGVPVRERARILRNIMGARIVFAPSNCWFPFVLVVPHGIGDAASSLDNSFDRCSLDELSRAATQVLSDRLLESDLSDIVRAVSRAVTRSAGSQQVPAGIEYLHDDRLLHDG